MRVFARTTPRGASQKSKTCFIPASSLSVGELLRSLAYALHDQDTIFENPQNFLLRELHIFEQIVPMVGKDA